jgi:hypothetical protein
MTPPPKFLLRSLQSLRWSQSFIPLMEPGGSLPSQESCNVCCPEAGECGFNGPWLRVSVASDKCRATVGAVAVCKDNWSSGLN